jgi:hypothetical protein
MPSARDAMSNDVELIFGNTSSAKLAAAEEGPDLHKTMKDSQKSN